VAGRVGTASTVITLTSADVARRDIHFESASGEMNSLNCPAGNCSCCRRRKAEEEKPQLMRYSFRDETTRPTSV
jgi:hypothetical protein